MNNKTHFDAVVMGAGFSGMYMLHRLRELGLSTRVYETAEDVGGVWYWNRYPGARCDTDSIYYNYTFSEELYREWTWSSRYPKQAEILKYLNFVADKLDLRRDIQFNTRVKKAVFDEEKNIWRVVLDNDEIVTARYFISGLGGLSAANVPNIKGLESFQGEWYHAGRWPRDKKVDIKGKRVGVIGTGSSGIQAIPVIAKEADHLTVFQRTAQYSLPARDKPLDPEYINEVKRNFWEIRKKIRTIGSTSIGDLNNGSALDATSEERKKVYRKYWEMGGSSFMSAYNDLITNEEANETASEFVRSKIQEIVKDPKVAEKLLPTYPIGTKRIVLDTDYFETYNRDNVTLVDVKSSPIAEITPKGIRTTEEEYELDIIVLATGYDGMTGPLFKVDIQGKNGVSLKEKWKNGEQVRTHLGISIPGFPNFFTITGPQSPAVLGVVPIFIEQHVEWISDCIEYIEKDGIDTIEATEEAAEKWTIHCNELAHATLYLKTDSWYTGANIDGKPRGFLLYTGGMPLYRKKLDEAAANGYDGFLLKSSLKR